MIAVDVKLADPFGERVAQAAPETRQPAPDSLLGRAVAALNDANVPYCYWKQTAKLDRVFAGQSDLDLLVSRSARESFCAVMDAIGFKAWPDADPLSQPQFASFLGYDEELGLILHVHAHFRLVLGDALLKNFHIPIERDLIGRSVIQSPYQIRVLDPVDEELVGRLRDALEGRWSDVVAWRRRLSGGVERGNRKAAQVDEGVLHERVATFLPLDTAQLLARPGETRHELRRALTRYLKPWRLHGPITYSAKLCARSLYLALNVLNRRYFQMPRFARRVAPGGGVLIAFVGVDGSGKSTQAAQTTRWLASEIDVVTSYFGTGDGSASLVFRPIKVIAEAIGSWWGVKPRGASHGRVSDRPPGPIYSAMFIVWALAVALDKRLKLATVQKAVAKGFVVVTDRYPQNEFSYYNDGPLMHRLSAAPALLRKIEQSIYERAQRMPPDLVIKLHVGAAAVAKREPEMRTEIIQQRIDGLKQLSFGGANSTSIDANLPLTEVTRRVRRAVWKLL